MSLISAACAMLLAVSGSSVSGTVLSEAGTPAPGVRVFAEPGLGGALLAAESGADGAFRIENVPAGPVGVFVAEQGHAFTGRHINLAVGEDASRIVLRLGPAASVSGVIKSAEGETLKGAQITRVALTGGSKVGIPLTKLAAHGFPLPTSDAEGRFTVPNLPKGETVALKAGHAGYAQEGVQDVHPGASGVEIKLYRGVLVEGTVVNRAGNQPVANVAVLLRNAQPPHDTAVAETNARGFFNIRLKPGVYLYSASGAGIQSSGWEQMRVTGESGREQVKLAVASVGAVSGVFRDAVTSAPIAGVRVSLYANGLRADVQRTGPGGAYRFTTTEGANAVRIESAPGYLPPPTPEIPFAVTAGEETVLAEQWLAPMPRVALSVVDEAGASHGGALVQLLRPAQFGWQTADANGRLDIRLSAYPSGQRVLGFVESAGGDRDSRAALFALEPNAPDAARVQLYGVARLQGRVVSESGTPLPGVEVGGVFPGESDEEAPVLLWRVRTDASGQFDWPALVPGVPQQILARDASGSSGVGEAVNLAPGEQRAMNDLVISGGKPSPAATGTEWDPKRLETLCGDAPDWRALKRASLLVVYTRGADADAVAESLSAGAAALKALGVTPMVVTDGAYLCGDTRLNVLRDTALGEPRTLLIQPGYAVALETAGLPPLAVVKAFAKAGE